MEDKKLPLVEHLDELRDRIIKSLLCLILASIVFYSFIDMFLPVFIRPVGKLVFIAPQEAFGARIKLSLFGGLFLSSPVILYHIWRFVSAALSKIEKRYILLFGPLSFIFFISGVFFAHFIIVPIGVKFLLGFATDLITPMISISNYISFVGLLLLTFGVIFELPLVSLFLTKIGVVTPKFLSSRRKQAVVFIFISAAIITPPDVVTQVLMALPLLLLYEIGIFFSKIVYRPSPD